MKETKPFLGNGRVYDIMGKIWLRHNAWVCESKFDNPKYIISLAKQSLKEYTSTQAQIQVLEVGSKPERAIARLLKPEGGWLK